ncbi:hypothetical protein GCM10022223_63430 [Kineosporia mesophila]|uniref:D-isomer specific 2-hydroxyacid dehydrogenase NAD-binding domain-containing protein n=1 Tax=Kineosporia mesophila TaxID=566012 RepID=A0ABP7AN87_9ACTN|nr:NAD(P)-dependent oxidoreductase [Kineosporia mesophila]MCD5349398.1 hypothetical protein [Kineosporia mesophila]
MVYAPGLADFRAVIVTLHVPLDESTRNLIDEQVLAAMKPGSVLVNTARGGLVDEKALDRALRDSRAPVSVAAVDVFRTEGAERESPLIGNPYCILSPHVAGMTWSAMRQAVFDLCARITEAPG